MSGAIQATFMNQRSFGPPAIGAAYEGGFFAGQISTAGNGIADYNLVVGPLSTAQDNSKTFQIFGGNTPGTSSVIDGPGNTSNMTGSTTPAGKFCNDLVTGGFSDWYMPAKNELEVCYYNLKPGTSNNSTSSGTNANAVPARASNYTEGTPAQTSAAAFQSGGAEAFSENPYWTSTQQSSYFAWKQQFNGGTQYADIKYTTARVRAIRRVAV
jgi:hypothetical protein